MCYKRAMARGWLFLTLGVVSAIAGVAWYVGQVMPGTPQSYAGVEFAGMTPAAASRAPLLTTGGALIREVEADSPADKAGLAKGQVVAAIDGVPIHSAAQAAGIVSHTSAGTRVVFTVFDIPSGDIDPVTMTVDVIAEAPVTNKFSVNPPRVLAKEFFNAPTMAANAAWSDRLARGPTVRPTALLGLGSGQCNAFAPEGWRVEGHAPDNTMLHVAAPIGFQHALYASGKLNGQKPRDFVLALIEKKFQAAVPLGEMPQPFGFTLFKFGIARGAAGLAEYRVTKTSSGEDRIAVWLLAVPAADASWAIPRVGMVAFSIHCKAADAPALAPRDPSMIPTAVSARCNQGECSETDFAAQYMKTLRLGFVHDRAGRTWMIKPRSDFWVNGAEGPGYYRQLSGENEKLEPGRTN